MKIELGRAFFTMGALFGLSLLGGCASLVPATPLAPPGPSALSPISEVRVGGLVHDPLSPEAGSVDLSGEMLFNKPFHSANPVIEALIPRPDIGGTANFVGKTSEAYAGVAWDYNITPRIFAEGAFGGSVNDGKTGHDVPPGFNSMGCNESFRESGSLGYRLTPNWSVMGTIEHMSNAGLCGENRGLTNFGARVGYAF